MRERNLIDDPPQAAEHSEIVSVEIKEATNTAKVQWEQRSLVNTMVTARC
jgi:hypothetical protein